MAGSPKKRARRLAAQASGAQAGARARSEDGANPFAPRPIPSIPPERLPSDEALVAISKGVLLAVALGGSPQDQVRAAWQLADVARRGGGAEHNLDKLTNEELEQLAKEAGAALGSPMQ